MKKTILTLLVTFIVAYVWGNDIVVDGIYYNLLDENTCEVTWNSSNWDGWLDPDYNSYSGDVVVPPTVSYDGVTYTVVGVGESAFRYCRNLTSLSLPESVTYYGDYSFQICTSLETFTISSSVTSIGKEVFISCTSITAYAVAADNSAYTSVDGVLYTKDVSTLVAYPTASERATFSVPNTVSSIETGAFSNATNLTEVTMSENLTTIGTQLFSSCTNIEKVTFFEGITLLAASTFHSCSNLKEVNIPASVTTIAGSAFYLCSSLPSLTFPDNLTAIEARAFEGCTSLTEIEIPGGVETIGRYAYVDCTGIKEVILHDGTTMVDNYAFDGCISMTDITLPSTLTYIGRNAFGDEETDVRVRVYSLATTPPECYTNTVNQFAWNVQFRASQLYVPDASVDAYKKATGWDSFAQWDAVYPYVAPMVETLAAEDITYMSATLSSNVVEGSQSIKEYGFEYWTNEDDVQVVTSSEPIATLSALSPYTKYTYRAYATNPASGAVYGEEKTFTTDIFVAPMVTTYAATEVTYNSALLRGYVEEGSDAVVEKGFEYWADDASEDDILSVTSSTMVLVLSDLSPSTTYTYRAYAVTDTEAVYYSDEMSFATDDVPNGISSLKNTETNERVIYNLQGIRVADTTQRGVYIMDGKKVLIK